MKFVITAFFIFIWITSFSQNQRDKISNDTLSLEQRIWGLSLLWHEVRNDFAYYDILPFNWDSTYKSAVNRVANTDNRYAYYQELRKLAALLHDGHTNVFLPQDLQFLYNANPPIRLKRIGTRVFIESILNDTLSRMGVKKKDELISINNAAIQDYAINNILPFVSASTEQDRYNRTFTNELLSGYRYDSIKLVLQDIDGTMKTVIFSRNLSWQRSPFPPLTFTLIPSTNIGLLTLNTFDGDTLQQALGRVMKKASGCAALIIDLHRNGGGNGDNAFAFQQYFFDSGYYDTWGHTRYHVSAPQSFGYPKADLWMDIPKDSLWISNTEPTEKFLKPLVLITGEKTFSAAEDFTATIAQNKRAVLIGTATGGSTGMNTYHDLPGGGRFRLTVKKDTFKDGKEFIGVGIQPDIPIQESVQDFLHDKNPALDAAIKYLSSGKK